MAEIAYFTRAQMKGEILIFFDKENEKKVSYFSAINMDSTKVVVLINNSSIKLHVNYK